MTSPWKIDVRPRTTGEVLDDAWRLYLHAPLLLLTLSGVFTIPLAVVLVLLLTRPEPTGFADRALLPSLAALLLVATGLGSGACQAAFHRLAEGKPMTLGSGLRAALARAPDHLAVRSLVLLGLAVGCAVLVIPAVAVWVGSTCLHPVLAADRTPLLSAIPTAVREVQRNTVKALGAILVRPVLWLFVVLNLYLCVQAALWVADDLAGFSVPLLSVLCSWHNPTFLAVLGLLGWVLLTPYAEAVNFFVHLDARARYEGLDLWYQTRRHFPASPAPTVGGRPRPVAGRGLGLVLLVLAAGGVAAARAPAAELRQTVHRVREQVAAVRQEVESANPYPGGAHWEPRLRRLADELDPPGRTRKDRFRWFRKAVTEFAGQSRDAAVKTLTNVDRQLALAEDSLAPSAGAAASAQQPLSREEIKRLAPRNLGEEAGEEAAGQQERPPPQDQGPDKPVTQDDQAGDHTRHGPGRRASTGAVHAAPAGLSGVGWFLLAGLAVAVVAAGVLRFLQQRRRRPVQAKPAQVTPAEGPVESELAEPTPQAAANLWKQADELARRGNYLGAVRALYLAVLARLHSARLIRYERTRTNREYVTQLRSRPAVQQPFQDLTAVFEQKWYGERACRPDDFAACRGIAEQIRGEVS